MCDKIGCINFDIEAELNKFLYFWPKSAQATNEQNAANNTLVDFYIGYNHLLH